MINFNISDCLSKVPTLVDFVWHTYQHPDSIEYKMGAALCWLRRSDYIHAKEIMDTICVGIKTKETVIRRLEQTKMGNSDDAVFLLGVLRREIPVTYSFHDYQKIREKNKLIFKFGHSITFDYNEEIELAKQIAQEQWKVLEESGENPFKHLEEFYSKKPSLSTNKSKNPHRDLLNLICIYAKLDFLINDYDTDEELEEYIKLYTGNLKFIEYMSVAKQHVSDKDKVAGYSML